MVGLTTAKYGEMSKSRGVYQRNSPLVSLVRSPRSPNNKKPERATRAFQRLESFRQLSMAPQVRGPPNALTVPALSGSAVSSITFWLSAVSSLVCSDRTSNCLRACSVDTSMTVSYTHLRAHETDSYLVCRLLLEKKN